MAMRSAGLYGCEGRLTGAGPKLIHGRIPLALRVLPALDSLGRSLGMGCGTTSEQQRGMRPQTRLARRLRARDRRMG